MRRIASSMNARYLSAELKRIDRSHLVGIEAAVAYAKPAP
jgi:hypothetical protein